MALKLGFIFIFLTSNLMASELKFDCSALEQISKKKCLDKKCQFKLLSTGPDGISYTFGTKGKWLIFKDQTNRILFEQWSDVLLLATQIKQQCPILFNVISNIPNIDKKVDSKRFNYFSLSQSPVENPQKGNPCSELLQLKTKFGILYSFGLSKECFPKKK
ncbi:MAG: hypothetical protein COW00_10885 [Bdellovibrio sp. CG12_big_fil_rev_8_21_14_0_65_39_13]|nr:MAG: hypothetical protein COW78_16240 [Bdellovibrio sp. CG22_combo_CG10-13_8_21_14_all_39_27]PIQ59227.1 MAG: hypothetical protein COW00_10885 [Bdellovibrio sp. CG12_big_fil_rev_8_21_14_0_65_39_13]PIR32238.1 MAG: hypothetical protein COV37_20175 [Bdellovibrio sp. CG11_big_fil_rev_8_21_14_0_20_39_38]